MKFVSSNKVTPASDWAEANAAGRESAADLVLKMIERENPVLLGWAINQLVQDGASSGFTVGFAQQLAETILKVEIGPAPAVENSAAPTVQETSRSVGTTRLLRLPEVMARTGLSRATIYRWIKSDLFPAPRKCGSCTFWRESDVHEWINNLV